MEKYYGQCYYEVKYFVCPNCNTISNDTYLNFYNKHASHISQFRVNKKNY